MLLSKALSDPRYFRFDSEPSIIRSIGETTFVVWVLIAFYLFVLWLVFVFVLRLSIIRSWFNDDE